MAIGMGTHSGLSGVSALREVRHPLPRRVCCELLGDGAREGRLLTAGVFGGDGLDERDPGLFGGGGVVTDAAGDDEELTGADEDVAAIGLRAADAELAAQDEEHLVFGGVRVPGELSVDARYLDVLIVDLTEDSRRPQLGESTARKFKRDGMLLHR